MLKVHLVIDVGLLLILVVIVAATLSSSSRLGLALLACLRGRRGVPGLALCGRSALVRQAEELSNILDVVRGKVLQHLLISHTLTKCNQNKCIGDTSDGVANLREPLDEGVQRLP
jgi:hypothetical protein